MLYEICDAKLSANLVVGTAEPDFYPDLTKFSKAKRG
jgi:hypothetical protein